MPRSVETLSSIIHDFRKRNSLDCENPAWEIKKSQLGGFGVFATKDIDASEVIFKDFPVILGPRAALTCPVICVSCYKKTNLEPCKKNCGLQVCSDFCQNSSLHQKECKIIRQWQTSPIEDSFKLCKVLSPIRSLFLGEEDRRVVKCLKAHLSPQHGTEVDIMKDLKLNIKEEEEHFMRFVCSVMDSNAFEVIVGDEDHQSSVRGLYPLASLVNHSCTPNATHVFDEHKIMVVRASKFIKKDSEIFHSYSRLIWGSRTRRFHLYRTKHFLCKCERCKDPTEFGTYMASILCKNCNGRVIQIQPLVMNSKWMCETCGQIVENKDAARVLSLLGSILNSFTDDDTEFMLRFLQEKLPQLAPENSEVAVELKYKLVWIFGYRQGLTWLELPEKLLSLKETFCRDLLNILEKLRLGQCKIRALLLYELYNTLREQRNRGEKSGVVSKGMEREMKILMEEAADILMFDVGAAEEIKQYWDLKKRESSRK